MTLLLKNLLIIITCCGLTSLVIGCHPSNSFNREITPEVSVSVGDVYLSNELPTQQTETDLKTLTILVSPTATDSHLISVVSPTAVTKVTPTRTLMPESTPKQTPTPDLAPMIKPETLKGTLFIAAYSEGFLKATLNTNEVETLVPVAEEWLLWRFAVSPNQEKVAYWVHTSHTSELWLSSLIEWSPELLLSFSSLEHNALNLWWLSNDYLLLEPGTSDEPLNLFVPLHAYIINIRQRQIEVEDSGFTFGCLLAPSPKTNEVATWCPAKGTWTDVQSYYTNPASYYVVVEEDGFLWTTTNPPVGILTQLRVPADNWAWSGERSLVAFPQYNAKEERGILLFSYTEPGRDSLDPFVNMETRYMYFNDEWAWSPDKKHLAIKGECSVHDCYYVIDVNRQQTVWKSELIPSAQHLRSLAWSYDSQHFALSTDEGMFIVEIATGITIKQLTIPAGNPLVWMP